MTRKSTTIICLIAAAVVGLGVLGFGAQRLQAQAAANQPTSVAVVRVGELIKNCKKNTEFQAELTKRRAKVNNEAKAKKKAIDVMRQDIINLTSAEARAEQERKIIKAMAEYQAWGQIQEQFLIRDQRLLLIELYDDIDKTVAKVAKQQKIDLVLFDTPAPNFDRLSADGLVQAISSRRIIYRTDRVDLTKQVLAQMDLDHKNR